MIRISSKREGFRRCGMAHSVAPVEYPDSRWSPVELTQLLNEPMLTVELITPPPLSLPSLPDLKISPKRTYTRSRK